MSERESLLEKWINPIKKARVYDFQKDRLFLKQESVKPVTLSVPAWLNTEMNQVCESCGWPLYPIKIGLNFYQFCTNPECVHCQTYAYIMRELERQDQIIQDRRVRSIKKKAEAEAKAEEDRLLEAKVEGMVRRLMWSFGYQARRVKGRAKK